ncbi:hypothetical protein SAMN05519104_5175 [Rhizobiales bacterium GAS188]|nr:hypothetical protein SAMN05519104_5175 [Rhizobiales bacterium GAS188]
MDYDGKSQTIFEFCQGEGIGRSSYYYLKAIGRAPDEMVMGDIIRISPEAKRRWRERMEREPVKGSLRELALAAKAARETEAA